MLFRSHVLAVLLQSASPATASHLLSRGSPAQVHQGRFLSWTIAVLPGLDGRWRGSPARASSAKMAIGSGAQPIPSLLGRRRCGRHGRVFTDGGARLCGEVAVAWAEQPTAGAPARADISQKPIPAPHSRTRPCRRRSLPPLPPIFPGLVLFFPHSSNPT